MTDQNEPKATNKNVLLLIFYAQSFGKLITILKYFIMFQWEWHLTHGAHKIWYAIKLFTLQDIYIEYPRWIQSSKTYQFFRFHVVRLSVSTFLCPDTYLITSNQQVSLCQPKLIIRAALPNRQLHPVVWATCLAALLLSAFQAKEMTSFSLSVARESASELCLAPIA